MRVIKSKSNVKQYVTAKHIINQMMLNSAMRLHHIKFIQIEILGAYNVCEMFIYVDMQYAYKSTYIIQKEHLIKH